ncbi:MAG: DUF115 domain-containing protein [Spirochaetaceae bacterium]|nr:MAG: DUF115 domain-containing protein [Spirochaetaceae bacterium]
MRSTDESLFRKNMDALRSSDEFRSQDLRHQTFRDELEHVEPTHAVSLIEGRGSFSIPEIRTETSRYALHSKYNPAREAERAVDAVDARGTLCVFGLGAAYHIRRLLAEPRVLRILVISEPPEVVRTILSLIDLSDVLKDRRLHLSTSDSVTAIRGTITTGHVPFFSSRITGFHLPVFARVFPDCFERFRHGLDAAIEDIADDLSTQVRFSKLWFRNILLNSVSSDRIAPASLPDSQAVTIVAAGPSLDEHLGELSRTEHHLICCDTAAPALAGAGIAHATVICIDPSLYGYHHLLNGFPDDSRTILDIGTHPTVWKQAPRPAGVASRHPLVQLMTPLFDHLPVVHFSGDVTNAAVWLARSFACAPIRVIGADYRWTGGRPYAQSTYIPKLFLGSGDRFAPGESKTVAFMFDRHQKLGLQSNGDYAVPEFDSRRKALQNLLDTPLSCTFVQQHRTTSVTKGTPPLKRILQGVYDLLEHVPEPEGGSSGPETYYTGLDEDGRSAALLLAPLATHMARRFQVGSEHDSMLQHMSEARCFARMLISHVHSLSGSRIL